MKQILDFMDKPVIKVITGMRRADKSVLLDLTMKEVRKRGVEEHQIFFANFESLQFEELKDYKILYQAIITASKAAKGKLYLFIDEIQEVPSWERVINSVRVDCDCDIYITGSNARLLSGELATLLSGRYVEISVYPLSFCEYIEFAKTNDDEAGLSTEQHFSNFLRYGGLPRIHEMKWDDGKTRALPFKLFFLAGSLSCLFNLSRQTPFCPLAERCSCSPISSYLLQSLSLQRSTVQINNHHRFFLRPQCHGTSQIPCSHSPCTG